jgi:formylglycine-generating enzyme required for sulfatase activity
MAADDRQFAVIYPKFKERGDEGSPVLTAELDRKLPADTPASDARRETLVKRQANAAVALLRMNQPDKVWPLLRHSPDPRVRSYLVHRLSPLGADAGAILQRLAEEPDLTARRALLLGLGEFGEQELPPATRTALLPKLHAMYRTEADPGLHGAVEWLLRRWQQAPWIKQVNDEWAKDQEQRKKRLEDIGKLLAKDKEKTPPQWYVNTQGQTLVLIPGPVEFRMGSPLTEKDRNDSEAPHRRRIGRSFAIAAKSVTTEQYRRFAGGHSGPAGNARAGDLPAVRVSWYTAAAYCNWLSKEEGIEERQWCYEIEGQVTKLQKNYLSLSGYRLPTEAEMEYATRAGALTSRYFGETDELLPNYAWFARNSKERSWPVGILKPNDLGLFDVQGNVLAWCQESYRPYPAGKGAEAVEDLEDGLVVGSTVTRVLRGGSFLSRASVRSANRYNVVPTFQDDLRGIRPARTVVP